MKTKYKNKKVKLQRFDYETDNISNLRTPFFQYLRLFLHKTYIIIIMISIFGQTNANASNIPEPEIIIYGKIKNTYYGYELLITNGILEWQIKDRVNESQIHSFSTVLNSYNDKYSYVLQLPFETASYIKELTQQNKIVIDKDTLFFNHTKILVNGLTARIIPPAEEFFTVSQATRAQHIRLDLEIVFVPGDTDNDGMPDFWEIKNNLNINSLDDANLDPDQDGWNNLKEFERGTNPHISNRIPDILETRRLFYVPEGGRTIVDLFLRDSDSNNEDINITLTIPPKGGDLILRGGSPEPDENGIYKDKILTSGDSFTWKDSASGFLHFKHKDPTISTIQMCISIWDKELTHEPTSCTLTALVQQPLLPNSNDVLYWMNMYRNAYNKTNNEVLEILKDYSKHASDSVDIKGNPTIGANPDSLTTLVLNTNNNTCIKLPDAINQLSQEIVIFSVFKSNGNSEQILFSTPKFQFGITGSNNSYHPGVIEFNTNNKIAYSNQTVNNKWVLAEVNSKNNDILLRINGVYAGKSIELDKDIEKSNSSQLGGININNWNYETNEIVNDNINYFDGQIGELIMFYKDIPDMKRWSTIAYLLSKWFGFVVRDGAHETRLQYPRGCSVGYTENYQIYLDEFIPRYGKDHQYMFIGGSWHDELRGSHEDDILVGGKGSDHLYGFGGKDIFVVNNGDTVYDFNPVQGDIINIIDIIEKTNNYISNYVHFETNGLDSFLKIDSNGDNSGFTDAVIILKNILIDNSDLTALCVKGNLEASGLRPKRSVYLKGDNQNIAETDINYQEFEFVLDTETIPENFSLLLAISGSAILGEDYHLEARQYDFEQKAYFFKKVDMLIPVFLKPGDTKYIIRIIPEQDGVSEPEESITISLKENMSMYDIVSQDKIDITLSDGKDRINIQAQPTVIRESFTQESKLLITRIGAIDTDRTIVLNVKGSAENGVDYEFIPTEINIPYGQSEKVVYLKAYPDNIREQTEIIEVKIVDNDQYLIGKQSSTLISILDKDAPIVNAGKDIDVTEGMTVILDASKTSSKSGIINWQQLSGLHVELENSDNIKSYFVAPKVGIGGARLVFRLSIVDEFNIYGQDEVNVNVLNISQGNLNNDDNLDLIDLILALKIASGETIPVELSSNIDINSQIGIQEAIYILQLLKRGNQ